jgi:hypothetical protein
MMREVLSAYYNYAKKEIAEFYSVILDELEPPPEWEGKS